MSKVIRHEQCPEPGCDGAGDNVAVYDNGTKHCFGCGTKPKGAKPMVDYVVRELPRGLTEETCKFFQYGIGKYTGFMGTTKSGRKLENETVHVANYYDDKGRQVAQKLRSKDKLFTIRGDGKAMPLYGQWKWSPTDKLFVTVVEGEIDALTVAQVQGYQYPVVSLPKGSNSARSSIKENLKWLLGFKYVILAFDNDEAGKKATADCLELFPPGKVKVATWPTKDANDMLMEGRQKEITSLLFSAKAYEPENIVTVSDIIDEVLEQPQQGENYPWASLTNITYGFQPGEIHIVVAANGIGKSEYVKDLMFHFLESNVGVGLFSFEQRPASTIRRLVGARLNQKLHLPGSEWNEEQIKEEAKKLDNKIHLCNNAGSMEISEIFTAMRFLAVAKGKKLFIIDNLKGLDLNDRDKANGFMRKLQALCLELQVTVILLSHVAKDKYKYSAYVSTSPKNTDAYETQTAEDIEDLVKRPGMEWESGRMPSKENVDGHSAICDLADYVFALARNTTSEDPDEQHTLRVKCLKARMDGAMTGKSFKLFYGASGKLEEKNSINSGGVF